VFEDNKVLTAGMITPPFGLVLAQGAQNSLQAIQLIVRDLHERKREVPDVNGPKFHAEEFAKQWSALTGQSYELQMAERVYELRQVAPPSGIPGQSRLATLDDLDLIVNWMEDFLLEALEEKNPREVVTSIARNFVEEQRFMLWLDEGQVVSMALRVRDTPNGAIVSYVYTPPELRRRGYATALVAELSQHCLDGGIDFCMLFTDLANPTSNSIYQQIGYNPICDFDKYTFIPKE
jgi:predicted GNAT family acetyltransferase